MLETIRPGANAANRHAPAGGERMIGSAAKVVARMGASVPPMFFFRDPSGHTLMVVEV